MEALKSLTAPAVEAPSPAQETTKPLKLSEAIRLGAMMTEQAFGTFGDQEHTCGIGAAQIALGLTPSDGGPLNALLRNALVTPPCDHDNLYGGDVRSAIIHLNDDHHWPREKVADWLEGLGL
jgi:hypothetical protein